MVAEFKSPGILNLLHAAIDQLLRYSNQRRELFPTLYTEDEGVERLFHTNQVLVASDFFEARAGTVGAPPEAYLEWADTSPVPMTRVAAELGRVAAPPDQEAAAQERAMLGAEQAGRVGRPLFFRAPEQRPAGPQGQRTLQSQQILTRRGRSTAHERHPALLRAPVHARGDRHPARAHRRASRSEPGPALQTGVRAARLARARWPAQADELPGGDAADAGRCAARAARAAHP